MLELIIWTVLLLLGTVNAAQNVTVDDTSPTIRYTGTWQKSTSQSGRYNGTTHWTKTQDSYASFTFSGATNVYYIGYGLVASRVPNTMMDIEFDSTVYHVNQSTPAAARAQAIIWSIGGLDPQSEHTIVCKKTSATGATSSDIRMDVNIDAFMLTIPDEGDIVPTAAGQQTSPLTVLPGDSTSVTSTLQTSPDSPVSQRPTSVSSSTTNNSTGPTLVWIPADAESGTIFASVNNSSASSSYSQTKTTSVNANAVIGGTLGAIAFVVLIAALFFVLARRRRRANDNRRGQTELYEISAAKHSSATGSLSTLGSGSGTSRRFSLSRLGYTSTTTKAKEARPLSICVSTDVSSIVSGTTLSTYTQLSSIPPAYTARNSRPPYFLSGSPIPPVLEERKEELFGSREERTYGFKSPMS